MDALIALSVPLAERRNAWLALQTWAAWLRGARKLVPNTWPRVDDTHRHAWNGTHRDNQLGLPAKCSRNKPCHSLRIFQPLRFDHELMCRAGMRARSGTATARIRGIGRRWQNLRESQRKLSNPTPPTFAQGDTARTRGTGRTWEGWWVFRAGAKAGRERP